MDGLTFTLTGVEEIERNLKRLTGDESKKALRRALHRGAKVIADQAKANALRIDDPQTADQIAKNIAIRSGGVRNERREGGLMKRVGVMGGAKPLKKGTETGLPGGNTTHWRFVEFGTSEARAQPFLRPAAEMAGQRAVDAVTQAAIIEIDKQVSKR